MLNYNLKEMRESFEEWTPEEIAREYVKVTKQYTELVQNAPYEKFIREIEEVEDNRNFLGHFLAMSYCVEQGYMVE